MTTYQITVTEAQAGVLSQATEMLARLSKGQFGGAMRDRVWDSWHTDMEVEETAHIAWDLYQVLRHRLAWDRAVEEGVIESADTPRKWPEMFSVSYDDAHRVSEQPLAFIAKELGK